jgi:hypothetical protein
MIAVTIKLQEIVGKFAENKDLARDIRQNKIIPALQKNQPVILDFSGIEVATQSFIHALISDLIRQRGQKVLDQVSFKSCGQTVRQIIEIVVEYMQEGL